MPATALSAPKMKDITAKDLKLLAMFLEALDGIIKSAVTSIAPTIFTLNEIMKASISIIKKSYSFTDIPSITENSGVRHVIMCVRPNLSMYINARTRSPVQSQMSRFVIARMSPNKYFDMSLLPPLKKLRIIMPTAIVVEWIIPITLSLDEIELCETRAMADATARLKKIVKTDTSIPSQSANAAAAIDECDTDSLKNAILLMVTNIP